MGNSYCGKDCNDCLDKGEVGCPGCKEGPGKAEGSLCDIASCCQQQCKESCATCGINLSCEVLAGRDTMLQKWNKNRTNEASMNQNNGIGDRKIRDGHDAPFLRKTLMTIFWLYLATVAGNVMSNVLGTLTGVSLFGSLISLGAAMAQAVLMIRLGEEERAYKVAGICNLISFGLTLVGSLLIGFFAVMTQYSGMAGVIGLGFGAVLILAAIVLSIVGNYRFLVANAKVVEDRDAALSDRWRTMSRLFFAVIGGLVLVLLLIVTLEWIGIIIALFYVLGVLAFGICEYVFLYQTAECFHE